MAKKVAITKLNARTVDILNVIRENAGQEYQDLVPKITDAKEIVKVGEIVCGYPSVANRFISELVNRIALVRARSATFNNPFKDLKKGYLEFGETVEDIFVQIANVRTYDVSKTEAREFKRTVPDIKARFYIMNWRVQYPVTIEDEELATAFLSEDGVTDMIARIVDSVYQAAEYDEYLLFKYLIIKGVTSGRMKPISIGDGTDIQEAAIAFRATGNQLGFLSKEYNAAAVRTNTPIERTVLFMDATFQATYGVKVLSAAFNMGEADYLQKVKLIDDWTTFDNERWDAIRAESDQVELVTADELALMKNVVAVLCDTDWFQVYDNKNKFTEQYAASGMYWNYFYNVWKTVSSSDFANAIVFVTDTAVITAPATITATVTQLTKTDSATILTLTVKDPVAVAGGNVKFVSNETDIQAGVAVHEYGAYIIPTGVTELTFAADCMDNEYKAAAATEVADITMGLEITLSK